MWSNKHKYFIFYFGIFVSALGSNALVMIQPGLLAKSGMAISLIGVYIAANRITNFMANFLFGKMGDTISPVTVIYISEIGAFLSALAMLTTVPKNSNMPTSFALFTLYGVFRIFFVSLQSGSVQKILKHYDNVLGLDGLAAQRFSLISNLAIVVAGIVSLFVFDQVTHRQVILFDAFTFLFNCVVVFVFQSYRGERVNFYISQLGLVQYFRSFKHLFFEDAILSLCLAGSNVLNLKLLDSQLRWAPIMTTIFGLSGFLISQKWMSDICSRFSVKIFWAVFAVTLISQGFVAGDLVFLLPIHFVRNFCYWLILNQISQTIMRAACIEKFSQIASGRNALQLSILGGGELVTGFINIPIKFEMFLRGSFAIMGFVSKRRSE